MIFWKKIAWKCTKTKFGMDKCIKKALKICIKCTILQPTSTPHRLSPTTPLQFLVKIQLPKENLCHKNNLQVSIWEYFLIELLLQKYLNKDYNYIHFIHSNWISFFAIFSVKNLESFKLIFNYWLHYPNFFKSC